MTWFTAQSVSVTNGQTIVNVITGDDVQIAQEAGGLIIGNNPPVEIKRTFLDGGGAKKIELRSPWPYATQTTQFAVAFPTDGDLAEATRVLREVASTYDAQPTANSVAVRTANGRVKVTNATEANDALARGQVGTAAFGTVTTSATDATAGRLLKVGDFGLNSSASTALATAFANNANDVNINCTLVTSSTFTGSPFAGANGSNQGILVTRIWNSTGYREQHFFNVNSIWVKCTRRLDNGVWSDWVFDYHQRNILGTVSQSGGVPTGAIIQRGSNANGHFARFADGTQICTGSSLATATIGTAFEGGFRSGGLTQTLPIAFFDQNFSISLTPSTRSDNAPFAMGYQPSGSAASFGYQLHAVTSQASKAYRFDWVAIGRWF